jgi:predicted RNase H-like nuclease
MTTITGVDGCKAGWLCVTWTSGTGSIASDVYRTAADLLEQHGRDQVIGIDIPIGLPNLGSRACDTIARKMLGRRGCCVFPAPIRPLLLGASHAEASAARKRLEGKGVSAQAWGIVPKIREVDLLLAANPSLQDRVREVHPEISFMTWNRGVPIEERKKSPAGKAARAALIASRFGNDAFDEVRRRYPRAQVADDDINDAFAALWTTERIACGSARVIPESPVFDPAGLRIAVWY